MPAKLSRKPAGTVRIIGGEWRGRRFPVANLPGLRPTKDRIRETLFNWLSGQVAGRKCLDLFAGSGALGLEALSRGAAHCQFVDTQALVVRSLQDTLNTLHAQGRGRVVQATALAYLHSLGESAASTDNNSQPFDLVFLDPPFATGELLQHVFHTLTEGGLLASNATIYVEYAPDNPPQIPSGWSPRRSKRTGGVIYELYICD